MHAGQYREMNAATKGTLRALRVRGKNTSSGIIARRRADDARDDIESGRSRADWQARDDRREEGPAISEDLTATSSKPSPPQERTGLRLRLLPNKKKKSQPPSRYIILVVALTWVVSGLRLRASMMENVTGTSSINEPLLFMPTMRVIQGPQLMRPVSHYESLYPASLPIINVGMPKMGSTTLHHFLNCAGIPASHYFCKPLGGRRVPCATCMHNAFNNSKPPLASCGGGEGGPWHAFTEMNDAEFFPQMTNLLDIHDEVPNATFVLIHRNTTEWERSVTRWRLSPKGKHGPTMRSRFVSRDLPDLPAGKGGRDGELGEWFNRHILRVREFVRKNPSHKLVEVDLEDVLAGEKMSAAFGTNASCWGHANAY